MGSIGGAQHEVWVSMAYPRKNILKGEERTQTVAVADEFARSRIELEQALHDARLARQELESANRIKDRFLAALSHELRTPLTPILLAVQVLSRSPELSQAERDALQAIRRSVKIESNLIDDLLDYTRIARGKLAIDLEPIDLHAAITDAVEISECDIRGKSQKLTVALEATRYRTQGDFARLQNVVWNLLKNASKFTPEGGDISVRSRLRDGRFVVAVSDNGIGIDPSALPTIFEPFGRGDEWISREFGGLGLGLALSKATVEAHGGTIEAHSVGRDRGATFTVDLPLT